MDNIALKDLKSHRLDAGDIRILRASWLCQPSVARLARRQDLEQLERGGDSPFLSANEAFRATHGPAQHIQKPYVLVRPPYTVNGDSIE